MTKKVIIIGLGVAGQTAALSLTKHDPEITITIYEKVLMKLSTCVTVRGKTKNRLHIIPRVVKLN